MFSTFQHVYSILPFFVLINSKRAVEIHAQRTLVARSHYAMGHLSLIGSQRVCVGVVESTISKKKTELFNVETAE